jgi:hypothetical protein
LCSTAALTLSFDYDQGTHECVASFVCALCSFSTLHPSLDVRLPSPTARAAAIALEVNVPHYVPGQQFTVAAVFTPASSARTFQCAATQASLSLTTSVLVDVGGSTKDLNNPTGLMAELAAVTPGADVKDGVASQDCTQGVQGVGLSVSLQHNQARLRVVVVFCFTFLCVACTS